MLIPGMISHASNIVEPPELIAERLVSYVKLVGRENVIAGSDWGFSSPATFAPGASNRGLGQVPGHG